MEFNLASSLFLLVCIIKWSSAFEYITVEELNNKLLFLAADNPSLASVYTIGNSVQGNPIDVLKLGTNSTAGVPNVKIIGTIHGNEPVGLQVIWKLAEYIVNEYHERNEHIMNLLANVNVHMLPLLNPDGYIQALEGACTSGPGRNNANNVDLNRNFPSSTQSESVTGMPEPETDAIINWMQTHFMLSAAIHAGALVVNYPYDSLKTTEVTDYEYDNAESKTDDDEEFKHLSRLYAKTHGSMKHGCPDEHAFDDGITNGAAWYSAIGTMQDYNYDFHGCMEITIELSCCKYPHHAKLDEIWDDNKNAFLKFIEESQRGIKGIISKNKVPLRGALVSILGRDIMHTTTENGEYWRYLLPGNYYIKAEYENTTIVKKFKIPHQSVVKPVVLNIDMDEVNQADTVTEQYALSDIATMSFSESYVNLEIASTLQSSISDKLEYVNPTNVGSKIKICNVLFFNLILFVTKTIN